MSRGPHMKAHTMTAAEVREDRTRGAEAPVAPDDLSQNGDECERGRGTEGQSMRRWLDDGSMNA